MQAKRPSEQKISNNVAAQSTVRAIFDGIAADYDRFNAWASLGLHHVWRRALVNHMPLGAKVLDIATGTGDVAFMAAEAHDVVGLDFSERMLEQARAKDTQHKIRWVNGSADRLPFSDCSFGCISSAFALRNFRGSLDQVFMETYRVLRSGGKALHLDFGRPRFALTRWGHRFHLTFGIPLVGQWVCGSAWPKDYLKDTIEAFYEPEEVERRLKAAGFQEATHIPLMWGTVQLYIATKSC